MIGISGEYVLSSSEPSVLSVSAAPSRGRSRFSSSGLLEGAGGFPGDAAVYTLQAHAPGVASVLLRDRRQPHNAALLWAVVAAPAAIELRLDRLLLPLAKEPGGSATV